MNGITHINGVVSTPAVSSPPQGVEGLPFSGTAGAALPQVQAPPPAREPTPPASDPAQAQQTQTSGKAGAEETLKRMIEQALNESRVQTNLKFRVDKDANRVVVSVIDSETGETIMQIPDDAVLAIARRLAETGSGFLDQKA
jgi:flagellar protein FlaG